MPSIGSITTSSGLASAKRSVDGVSSSAARRTVGKCSSSGTSSASWEAVSAIVSAAFAALASPRLGRFATRPTRARAIDAD